MSVELYNQSSVNVPRSYLQKWVQFIFKDLARQKIITKSTPRSLVIVFLDQEPARQTNLQFRNKDYATDVLSFSGLDEDSLGELILCSQVVQRQAKEHKLSYRDECAYLVLHGILHLLGFEHENSDKEAAKMYSVQDALFAKIDKIKS